MTDKETEIVTGLVDSIITKGEEKWQAVVKENAEQTYGRKLWTKDVDQFNAITALIGKQATFECGVSEYEREGKTVRSLWINAVNPGTPPPTEPPGAEEAMQGVAQEATGATQSAQNTPERVTPTPQAQGTFTEWDRQASIETQSALKNAVEFYAALPPGPEPVDVDGDVQAVLKIAASFNAFLATKGVPF